MRNKKRSTTLSFKKWVLGFFIVIVAIGAIGCQAVETESATQTPETQTRATQTTETDALPNIAEGLKVYFLDVGQGDSIYIKTPEGDDILIDGGDLGYGDTLVQYLKQLHVDDIEMMIATHPHSDHMAGLVTVLQEFKVKSVYAPKVSHTTKTFENFLNGVQSQGLTIKSAKVGLTLPLEGMNARFVGPVKGYDDLNNYSAVLHLTYGDTAFLFTGDAEDIAEADMLSQNLTADVLKVGHHGSHTSTSDQFLQAIGPKYAIISAGKDNSYGHPHKETLNKLTGSNVKVYRTDQQGTIIAISDGKTITFNQSASEIITDTTDSEPSTASIKIVNVDLFKEVVTLKNTGTKDIEMTDWKLISVVGDQAFYFPNGYLFKAGASVQITSSKNAVHNPPSQLEWTKSNIWNNNGDPAKLYNDKGELIDESK